MDLIRKIFLLSMMVLPGIENPAMAAEEQRTDVRVLIDVSGSMKKNDPANLRIPAMKLLVNLLPAGSRVGVWAFAQNVEPLIPLGDVRAGWKEKAIASARGIHSKGLFTHIEKALKEASADWQGVEPSTRRSLILLTDGVVDVSKNKAESEQSRTRIIESLLPELQRTGAQVHTIALSGNADHALLKKIAFDTNGWNETVLSADQLQRVFLKMFKKAVPQDTLPLEGNKFPVDSSINEFSLLVFRKSGAAATRLIAPDRSEISQENKVESVHWHHDEGYDLITVANPAPGEWHLEAEVDPDNQVMIVTDLKLKVTELPNYATEKEAFSLTVSMTEQENEIIREDFLDLLTVTVVQTDDLDRKKEWRLSRDPVAKSHFFQPIGETLSAGQHAFNVTVDGKTFQRQMNQTIQVVANPVTVDVKASGPEQSAHIIISLIPDTAVVDSTTLEISARISSGDGDPRQADLVEKEGAWLLDIDSPTRGERIVVNFTVVGKSLRGNDLTPSVKPVVIDDKFMSELFPESVESEMEPVEENETVAEPDWLMTGLVTGGVNIVIFIGAFFGYKALKRRSEKQENELLERLSS